MAQKVVVYGASSYANTAALINQLNTTKAAGQISALHTADVGTVGMAAHAWAVQNGVPVVPLGARLDAEGYDDPFARRLRIMRLTNADTLVAAGSGDPGVAHIVSVATTSGKTVSQL